MPGIDLQRSLLRRGCSKRQSEERILSGTTLKRGDCRGDDIDQRCIDDSQEDLDLVPHREEVALIPCLCLYMERGEEKIEGS
jgi:hypothetical protein